jgi:hypothetical protein
MAYKEYSVQDLATAVMRPSSSFNPATTPTAIAQALLLFKIATCLAAPPEGEIENELVDMAVLHMADAISLSSEYAAASASPFSSESIGSYSYSKAAKAVSKGETTGIMWFDLAVGKLGVCDDTSSIPMGGGIEVFERDAAFVKGAHGNIRMLSPKDLHLSRSFGYDPAPGYGVGQVPGGGGAGSTDLEESTEFPGYFDPDGA